MTLAWYVTDAVGLLSGAMESFDNLACAIIALLMVTIARRPADEHHPYGHHKAEYFSSGFEGILIVRVAMGIIRAAASRLFDPQPLQGLGWSLGLSILSSALNGLLAWVMFSSAKVHRSIALEADAKHLVTDGWMSIGVVIDLIGVGLTGWLWPDAAPAIGVALNILREGVHPLKPSAVALIDVRLKQVCRPLVTNLSVS
jgi:cation diffusion facilitator family transporter